MQPTQPPTTAPEAARHTPDAEPLIAQGTIAAVQSDEWFFAPDGQSYRVAYGPVFVLRARDLLGFEPKNSANWFLQVGTGSRAIILAGCKLHFAMPFAADCPKGPHVWNALDAEEG